MMPQLARDILRRPEEHLDLAQELNEDRWLAIPKPVKAYAIDRLRNWNASTRTYTIRERSSDKLLGIATVERSSPSIVNLNSIIVKYQRMGYGIVLLRYLAGIELRDRLQSGPTLYVRLDNCRGHASALGFFHYLGFERIKDLDLKLTIRSLSHLDMVLEATRPDLWQRINV